MELFCVAHRLLMSYPMVSCFSPSSGHMCWVGKAPANSVFLVGCTFWINIPLQLDVLAVNYSRFNHWTTLINGLKFILCSIVSDIQDLVKEVMFSSMFSSAVLSAQVCCSQPMLFVRVLKQTSGLGTEAAGPRACESLRCALCTARWQLEYVVPAALHLWPRPH